MAEEPDPNDGDSSLFTHPSSSSNLNLNLTRKSQRRLPPFSVLIGVYWYFHSVETKLLDGEQVRHGTKSFWLTGYAEEWAGFQLKRI